MSKIKFMTDTASDLPLLETEQAGVDMLSILLTIQGDSYQEQRDLSKEEFYDLLVHGDEMPATSQITSFSFAEKFLEYAEQGFTDVIYVSINSEGSATYQNACHARETVFQEHPDIAERMHIHILDGRNYSLTYGYPVLQAAAMAEQDASVEAVLEYLQNWLSHVSVYFVPMTLKFVKKSGRLTTVSAFAGELLGLRPMICIRNGKISVVEKIRGEKNIIPRLTAKVKENMQPASPYLIIEGSSPAQANQAEAVLTEQLGYAPAYRTKVGSAVALNAGPELVAVVIQEKE